MAVAAKEKYVTYHFERFTKKGSRGAFAIPAGVWRHDEPRVLWCGGFRAGRFHVQHVERCAVILHLIDGTEEDVVGAYRTIRRELADYGHGLAEKPEIIGLNKVDAIDPAAVPGKRRALLRAAPPGTTVLAMSGVSGAGIQPVLGALFAAIEAARAEASDALVPGALVLA